MQLRNNTARLLQDRPPRHVQHRKLSIRAAAEAERVHRHRAAARDRRPAVAQLAALNPAEARRRKPQEIPTNRLQATVAQAAKSRQSAAIGPVQQPQAALSQRLAAIGPAQLPAEVRSQQSAAIGPAQLPAVARSQRSAATGPAQLQVARNLARQPDQLLQSSILQPAQKPHRTRVAAIPTPRKTALSSTPEKPATSPP